MTFDLDIWKRVHTGQVRSSSS